MDQYILGTNELNKVKLINHKTCSSNANLWKRYSLTLYLKKCFEVDSEIWTGKEFQATADEYLKMDLPNLPYDGTTTVRLL